MSILQKLTEGVQSRDMQAEGAALLNKWEATGLLEGLNAGQAKQSMAVLLENQAKELLREASSMAAGDVEGFAAVAFPIVRRVFGGLIANDLISVQPMSLPSGLIFFMDFTHSDGRNGAAADASLYGGGVVGRQIVDGVVDIVETGHYGFGQGYSDATGSFTQVLVAPTFKSVAVMGTQAGRTLVDYDPDLDNTAILISNPTADAAGGFVGTIDPKSPSAFAFAAEVAGISAANKVSFGDPDRPSDLIIAAHGDASDLDTGGTADNGQLHIARLRLQRRLVSATANTTDGIKTLKGVTRLVWTLVKAGHIDMGGATVSGKLTSVIGDDGALNTAGVVNLRNIVAHLEDATFTDTTSTVVAAGLAKIITELGTNTLKLTAPMRDSLVDSSNALGAIVGASPWALEEAGAAAGAPSNGASSDPKNAIPEIDIKVDSVAVTAQTKKLKAKWTPELGQDLNAYHNLDAEVELTGILSEQIALEIDRELLGELVRGATAGTRYWSRAPGLFVNSAGTEIGASSAAPDFTGTVSEWYETLIETVNDVSAQIHRKTLRGGANFVVCSPEVANILEFTSGFRASVTADQDRGTIGAVKSGSLSKKFDVYVDPYFLRNVLLVGRKGSSFLESGYVYAPYVPLQVTPTIFGTEDFVPRKGVMTRYAKKMVRPDMYGLVIVRGLLGEAGATS